MDKNILVAGVGGQGVLLLSSLIAEAAAQAGFDVKQNEVHGMSQRGGSVVCSIKFANKVYSPLIGKAEADLIIATEPLEAFRMIDYLKNSGIILYNNRKIDPMPVSIGKASYPNSINKIYQKNHIRYYKLNASELALKAGSIKSLNVVMFGAASNFLPFEKQQIKLAMQKIIPEKILAMNIKAYEYGSTAKNEV